MRKLFFFLFFLMVVACTSKVLKYDKPEQLNTNEEFEKQVRIVPSSGTSSTTAAPVINPVAAMPSQVTAIPTKNESNSKKKRNKKSDKVNVIKGSEAQTPPPVALIPRREPDLESTDGFADQRRPLVDPFRIGEEVTHDVHYFKVSAGEMKLRVDPLVEVNGRKSYSFVTDVRSSRMFSTFYSVEDQAVTLMDYELLIPRVFTLHVKESGQLREAKSFFDFDLMKATYWEKKVTEKSGIEVKKLQWDLLPYSQNVFSAIFYMRIFKWEVGKEYAFRVADDDENLVFKGKALRKEKIKTQVGEFNAIVIKPEILVKGAFRPVGDIYIWLSDDDRKYVLRIESSIRIGTLVSEITQLKPGTP